MEDRGQNLLGAFVLEVATRIQRETEAAIGHTGATAAALVTIAQFPERTVEDLGARSASPTRPPSGWSTGWRRSELVKRRPAGRGPAVALTATAAGRGRARQILDIRGRILAEALPALDDRERSVLVSNTQLNQ